MKRWRGLSSGPINLTNTAVYAYTVIKRPPITIPQKDVAAVEVPARIVRVIRNRNYIAQFSGVWFLRSVPGDSIGAREIRRLAIAELVHSDCANHVHRSIGQLCDVFIVDVQEVSMVNHQDAILKTQEVWRRDTVHAIIGSGSAIPAAVEHSPPG